jgi:MFS family permease
MSSALPDDLSSPLPMPSETFGRQSKRVLAGGFLGSVASVGFTIYLFGVFQDALVEAFSTSVAVLSIAPALFMVVSGVLSPFIGRSLATGRRPGLSIKNVMLTGAVLIGSGFLVLSRMTSLFAAAAAFVLLVAPGAIMLGPLLAQAMVTNWFDRKRGQALGIVSAGTTAGGVLIPPLAARLIEAFGWRDAMSILGGLVLILVLPAIAQLVVPRPEDVGEITDGLPAPSGDEEIQAEPAADTRELLRNPRLWLAGATFGLIFSAGTISTIFTVPYASQLGIPLLGGATVVSMRAGAAAIGKIVLGSLADRLGVHPVLYGVIAIEVGLTVLLVQSRDPVVFTALGVAIGFVGGSPLPLKAALVGQLFGRNNFPAAMGLVQSVGVPIQLLMVPVAGLVYQATGTYAAVFALTIPCFLASALFLQFVRPQSTSEASRKA